MLRCMGVGVCRILLGGVHQDECVTVRARVVIAATAEESVVAGDFSTFDDLRCSADWSRLAISIDISSELYQESFRVRSGLFL